MCARSRDFRLEPLSVPTFREWVQGLDREKVGLGSGEGGVCAHAFSSSDHDCRLGYSIWLYGLDRRTWNVHVRQAAGSNNWIGAQVIIFKKSWIGARVGPGECGAREKPYQWPEAGSLQHSFNVKPFFPISSTMSG